MKSSKLSLMLVAYLAVVGLAGTGCAPVFSELQSAKLVGRKNHELTTSATRTSFSSADSRDDGYGQTEIGLQYATGVSERVDLRARYVLVEGVHVVGFGPKVGLVRDRVALSVPLGFALNGEDSLQVHPTLLATAPLGEEFEVTGSLKYLIPLSKNGGNNLVAFNLGLGIGSDRWKLRPEGGILWNPGEKGHFGQFSLGLTFSPGR